MNNTRKNLFKAIGLLAIAYISIAVISALITDIYYRLTNNIWNYNMLIFEVLRFVLILALSVIIRNKLFKDNINEKSNTIICGACVAFLVMAVILYALAIPQSIYGTLAYSFGVYEENTPVLVSLVWEKIFSGLFMPQMLLGLGVILFRRKNNNIAV